MIWLAWRQHRLSLLAGAVAVAAFAIVLVATGLGMRHAYDALGLGSCSAPVMESCADSANQFWRAYSGRQFLLPLLLVAPALVGVFWGAPLVAREVEQGTHRLVWAQSITRRRWLVVKVVMLGAATLVALVAMTVAFNWWATPLMAVVPQQFSGGWFDLLGIMPAVYGLVALAIGVAAGTFSHKLIPAIAITLVAFFGLRLGVELGLRPNYMAAVTLSEPFQFEDGRFELPRVGDDLGWIMSMQTLDSAGRLISDGNGIDFEGLVADCPELDQVVRNGPSQPAATAACAQRMGFHVVAVYQPADRFWRFQVTEGVIFVAIAAGLIGTSAWWLRRIA